MHIKIINTYACKKHIANSNIKILKKTKHIGTTLKLKDILNILKINDEITKIKQ